MLLAKRSELKDGRINSDSVKAFYVRKGEAVAVYSTSLHFCPCQVDTDGFGCVVALPKGTNIPLDKIHEDSPLFRKNKWIVSQLIIKL